MTSQPFFLLPSHFSGQRWTNAAPGTVTGRPGGNVLRTDFPLRIRNYFGPLPGNNLNLNELQEEATVEWRLGKVRRGGQCTRAGSKTRTPQSIAAMDDIPLAQGGAIDMTRLKKSTTLWNNLQEYTRRDTARNTWQYIPGGHHGGPGLALPNDGNQQAWALRDTLLGDYVSLNPDKTRITSAEEDTARIVHEDIIRVLNALLKTRYSNQAQGHEGNVWDRQNDANIEFNSVRNDPFYPVWGSAVADVHVNPTGVDANKRAGFPDGILYWGPVGRSQVAVYEVKTHWSFADRLVKESRWLVTGPDHTAFDWGLDNWVHNMMKQIWAQLVCFSVQWGFWTNGRHIFVFVKRGDRELVVSEWHRYDSDGVMEVLAGLCFAAIDSANGAQGNNGESLLATLCPNDDSLVHLDMTDGRQQPW